MREPGQARFLELFCLSAISKVEYRSPVNWSQIQYTDQCAMIIIWAPLLILNYFPKCKLSFCSLFLKYQRVGKSRAAQNFSIVTSLPVLRKNVEPKCNYQNLVETENIAYRPGLKLFHLNIQSLSNRPHLTQLRNIAAEVKFDITISETWLNSTTNAQIKLVGYKLHRLDRLHKRGGGVCAYVHKELKSTVIKELSPISDRNFHQLWFMVQYKKSKSIVCVAYRPEDSPVSCFEDYLKPNYIQALAMDKQIVVLGDLNCDYLKEHCHNYRALKNFALEMNLEQLIKSPTRITDTTQSLIEVSLVLSPLLVRQSGVINISVSDHLPVYVELKLKSPKPIPQYVTLRSFKNFSPSLFTEDLASNCHSLLCLMSMM